MSRKHPTNLAERREGEKRRKERARYKEGIRLMYGKGKNKNKIEMEELASRQHEYED